MECLHEIYYMSYNLAFHVSHFEDADDEELDTLLELVFDLDNLSLTINNELTKPKTERNYVLEETYNSIYHVSNIHHYCYLPLNIYE